MAGHEEAVEADPLVGVHDELRLARLSQAETVRQIYFSDCDDCDDALDHEQAAEADWHADGWFLASEVHA